MLFSEVYGSYFNTVAAVLKKALSGTLTDSEIYAIVREKAFAESMLYIPPSLKNGDWQLLTDDMKTPLRHSPTMPLTTLQKRWMKSLLSDPRIALFGVSSKGLEDTEPLYEQDTFVYFDRYGDGDPYCDSEYKNHFHTVLIALREKRLLRIGFEGHSGQHHLWNCIPYRLEYSAKDDKFRLTVISFGKLQTINIVRIDSCDLLGMYDENKLVFKEAQTEMLIMELVDDRKALERAMHHFSHLKKETKRLDENRYQITLYYDKSDETEFLIRVLSFGPMIKVVSPQSFINLIRERLLKQRGF